MAFFEKAHDPLLSQVQNKFWIKSTSLLPDQRFCIATFFLQQLS